MAGLNQNSGLFAIGKWFRESRVSFSLVIFAIVVVQNIATTPSFFSMKIVNGLWSGYIPIILDQASELVMVSLGMMLITAVAGGQDISVGSAMAIAASFSGMLLNGAEYRTDVYQNPYILALIVGLLGGTACGAFNGFMVSVLRIQPLIASLILFIAGRSLAKMLTFGNTIYIMNPTYKYLGVQIPGIPIRTPLLVTIVVVVIVLLLIKKTSLGLYIESIGINSSASRLVGLNSPVIKFMTFCLSGMLCAVAGLVGASRVATVNSGELGLGIELNAILAVAIGGTLLSGGKFSIPGTIIGAYTIQAITTSLYAMNVTSETINVYKAVIIIIIVVVSSNVFRARFRALFQNRKPKLPAGGAQA
jgi:simple sugar transport system permease protein